MIQEQQQQTNQWVLTPVQFNLVVVAVVVTVVVVAVVIDQKLGKMTSPYSSTFSYKDNSISQFLW